jgi:hypothetical protein
MLGLEVLEDWEDLEDLELKLNCKVCHHHCSHPHCHQVLDSVPEHLKWKAFLQGRKDEDEARAHHPKVVCCLLCHRRNHHHHYHQESWKAQEVEAEKNQWGRK